MELKSYQQRTLRDLEDYIDVLNNSSNLSSAYFSYWMNKGLDLTAGTTGALQPYMNTVSGSPRVTMKVPTAGGKTFIACNALGTIMGKLKTDVENKVVAWFVPSDIILKQTLEKLQDTSHPYRQRIDALFGHRVNVIDKTAALAGQGLRPNEVRDNLTILVLSAASFIENIRVKKNTSDEMSKPLAYRENGNFIEYADKITDTRIEGVAPTALIQVLAYLRPVVIVDESHNFRADLRVEMLRNLSPRFILELTATPRDNSNVISFVDAMELKVENMVKLPVIVENRHSTGDVIASAIRLRSNLEEHAIKMEQNGDRYIRPIVLFQSQPRNDDDSVTFEKIKAKLIELNIPEEQVKIKTANKDELHGVDLMSRSCPVRYIITVNALKEGWDCPFAYILASLANRTSPVDVEQVLGRILRLPYTESHEDKLLNLSYVFTNSNEFQDTVTRIIQSLERCGYSRKDYREITASNMTGNDATDNQEHNQESLDLFSQPEVAYNIETADNQSYNNDTNDDFLGITTNEAEAIKQSVNGGSSGVDEDIQRLEQESLRQSDEFDRETEKSLEESSHDPLSSIGGENMYSVINSEYSDVAHKMILPMFVKHVEKTSSLFANEFNEVNDNWTLLDKCMLDEGFQLELQDATINFNFSNSEDTSIDIKKSGKDDYVPVRKKNSELLSSIRRTFVDMSASTQKEQLAQRLVKEVESKRELDSISHGALKNYVEKVIKPFDEDQIVCLWDHFYQAKDNIVDKIKNLLTNYREKAFKNQIAKDNIELQPRYTFLDKISFAKQELIGIDKGLYDREEKVNGFEERVIQTVADLDSVLFWHRNPERAKGFYINGFINHYPDFIVKMRSGKTVLIETKGDFLDNDESRRKRVLGQEWERLGGRNYRYFMVFEDKKVDGAWTLNELLDVLKNL